MRLRYAGVCRVCGTELPARSDAIYERSTRTVRCASHLVSAEHTPASDVLVDPGTPGASARREFERRRDNREQRVRTKRPRIGGLILALTDEPQTTSAWDTGAVGEELLGRRLNGLSSDRLRVLHDRLIPGTRAANIDHLAVTPTGIYVIDAKKYKGRPHLKVEGGLIRPRTERLLVGRRDCTKLVDGVLKQVDVVAGVVDTDVPVHAVLCFVKAEWPPIGGTFTTRGVDVLWPGKLRAILKADGPITDERIESIHRTLAATLRSA